MCACRFKRRYCSFKRRQSSRVCRSLFTVGIRFIQNLNLKKGDLVTLRVYFLLKQSADKICIQLQKIKGFILFKVKIKTQRPHNHFTQSVRFLQEWSFYNIEGKESRIIIRFTHKPLNVKPDIDMNSKKWPDWKDLCPFCNQRTKLTQNPMKTFDLFKKKLKHRSVQAVQS